MLPKKSSSPPKHFQKRAEKKGKKNKKNWKEAQKSAQKSPVTFLSTQNGDNESSFP